MSQPELDNLVRIGHLNAEPRDDREVTRMLAMARTRLSEAAPVGSLAWSAAAPAYPAG